MDIDLPAPPVPPNCDLRAFKWMPLDVDRLRVSSMARDRPAWVFRCAVLLWCAAWHEVPCSSIPDDPVWIRSAACLQTDSRRYQRMLELGGLHGFHKCNDGRLYHALIAEKALEALQIREMQSARGRAGAAARWKKSTAQASLQTSESNANIPYNSKNLPLPSLPSLSSSLAEFKNSHGISNGNGLRAGAGVTIENPDERLARFQASLVPALGLDGWNLIAAATDDTNPNHDVALARCKHAAELIGKGWPLNWPTHVRYS